MKRFRLGFSILLFGFLLLFVISCAEEKGLNDIRVSPQNPSIAAGTTTQFHAIAWNNDDSITDITNQVTWTSSNTTVANIDGSGLATGMAAGTTTITATINKSNHVNNEPFTSATTTLTVTSGVLLQISVTPINSTIGVATTEHFTATGTYTDGTSVDITTQVTWTSSNSAIATIDSGGLATGIALGITTITATSGNISGSTFVTVSIQ